MSDGSPDSLLRSRERAAMDMALRALRIIARLSEQVTVADTVSLALANNTFQIIEARARKTLRDIEALLPEAIKT